MISLVLLVLAQSGAPDAGSFAAEEVKPSLLVQPTQEAPKVQPTTTLKALLDSADQHNVDRRISAAQLDKAEADYLAAWSSLLPAISAQAGWTNNEYPATFVVPGVDPVTMQPTARTLTIVARNQFDASLRADLPLVDTQRWFRSAAAAASKESAGHREDLTRDQVKRAVISTWYNYATSLGVRDSAKKSQAAAEVQLKLQEIRERVGAATELELVRARAEVARNRQTVADAVRMIAVARRNLLTLTGVDPGEAASLPNDDMNPPAPLSELEARVPEVPAVQAAESDLRAAQRIATGAKFVLVPTIGAQFTQRFTNATGFVSSPNSFNAGITATWRLDVPTFANMASQSASELIAELNLEKQKLAARDQINTDWQLLQAALIKVSAAQAQVEASQRAQQVATTRYQAGAATQIDVITADRDLFQAEVQQIQARTDLASARLSLRISAAQPLDVQ